MSQAAPVTVTLDSHGGIAEITVGGHSIASAVRDAELTVRPAHRTTIPSVTVAMDVDEIIAQGKPPEDWKPDDDAIRKWIRVHEPEFKAWLARQARINGARPLTRLPDITSQPEQPHERLGHVNNKGCAIHFNDDCLCD